MDNYNENRSLLGFGLMRLPRKGIGIDIPETSRMIDLFMESGFTYFDTAFIYPGSEEAARKALVERYPRESYTLATKLYATFVPTEKLAKQEFETSLRRTGAGYIDYYLLHSLNDGNYLKYEKFHLWDFVKDEKKEGKIRHYGFSFHGSPEVLEKILTGHPDAEFVQLQINYADWESRTVRARENYEVARKHGKKIVIMEPVKGGKLANPPEEIKRIFSSVNPDASYASWALRFAASLDDVLSVLSGMSTEDQVRDNVSFMKNLIPLTEEEQRAIVRAQEIYSASREIQCTSCRYCCGGCPKDIQIPDIFAARNLQLTMGQKDKAKEKFAEAVKGHGSPADCLECRKCERQCPQGLKITDLLKECRENLE